VELRTLRAFLAVAKHRSFTLAADELFLTQSAVSQQIRSLEALLGTALFVRERGAVELSEAGTTLLPRAREVVGLVDGVRDLLGAPRALGGRLQIVAETVASSFLYVGLYERFARSYPEVSLALRSGIGREAALTAVREEQADAAFVTLPADTDDLDVDQLGTTELIAVALPGPRAERVLVWDGSPDLRRALELAGIAVAVSSNDIALIKRLVADGAGTAFLPRGAVKPELDAGSLEAVRFDLPPVRQRFGLVFRHAGRTPALAAFLATAHAYKPVIADLCASRDSPDR
jgi:DNA-binding transcriptional LysR family regulator